MTRAQDPNDYQISSRSGSYSTLSNAQVSCWSIIEQNIQDPKNLFALECFKEKSEDPIASAVILISNTNYVEDFINHKRNIITDISLTKFNKIIEDLKAANLNIILDIIDNNTINMIQHDTWHLQHKPINYLDANQREKFISNMHKILIADFPDVGFTKNKEIFEFENEYRFIIENFLLSGVIDDIRHICECIIEGRQNTCIKANRHIINVILALINKEFNSLLIPWDMSCKPFQNVFINPDLPQDMKDYLKNIILGLTH